MNRSHPLMALRTLKVGFGEASACQPAGIKTGLGILHMIPDLHDPA